MTTGAAGAALSSHGFTWGVVRTRLFVSSYAPLFAILAVRTAPGIGEPGEPLWPFVVSSALVVVGLGDCWFLLWGASRRSAISVTPTAVDEQGAAVAGYLPTYLLPFIGLTPDTIGGWIGYGIYLLVLLVVFLSSDFALVNPTLYLLGRRVVRVTRAVHGTDPTVPPRDETVLLIARQVPAVGRPVDVTRLSGCWVEKGK